VTAGGEGARGHAEQEGSHGDDAAKLLMGDNVFNGSKTLVAHAVGLVRVLVELVPTIENTGFGPTELVAVAKGDTAGRGYSISGFTIPRSIDVVAVETAPPRSMI
jgi:hypothetical protein